MKKIFLENKGQFIVELLVVIGLAAVVLPAILTSLIITRSGRAQQNERTRAIELLKEQGEAVRVLKETDWSFIENNGTYNAQRTSDSWILASSSAQTDGYTVSVDIADTERLNGAIVNTGGEADPSTKKVTITVSWQTPISSSISEVMYLSRYKNLSDVTTTAQEFSLGALNGTTVVNTSGGEVILGAGGGGDWCSPNLSITALDLPKSGVANAISAIEGRVFAGTGDNASGVSFANVAVNNNNPPSATVSGTFDGYKTNAVFGDANYAYLATDTNSKEVTIVDLNNLVNGKYVEAGYFNAPFNQNGNGVYVAGNVGYMTTGNLLYTFDLSSKTGSRPQMDSLILTIFGTARKLWIQGNYAYIAVDGYAPKELSIVDISNPNNIHEVGYADVNSSGGKEVYVNSTGTRAYLATSADSSKKEFFIIDTSTKSGNRPIIGSYEANGMSPKGVAVVPGSKAILVGSGGEEYQVVNLTDETNPARCGGLQIDTGINGVSGVLEQDGDAYSYIVTGDATSELKIIEGGPGGQFSTSGTFESEILDASRSAYFNRLSFNFQEPALTDIKFQAAGADAVNGSCTQANYVFVGPDKTSSTYFEAAGGIPADNDGKDFENPARCFKFKAFYTTQDPVFSPTLYDVTVNYSP